MTRPSEVDVADLISLRKSLVRIMEWNNRPSTKSPQWKQFESLCYLGTTLSDEVEFKAHYRPAGVRLKGAASIAVPEAIYVSIFLREHRIAAMDTLPGQQHTNRNVKGREYSGQTIRSTTHVHMWTESGEGYVEPVEPPILDAQEVIAVFCNRVNLWLNGEYKDPMFGQTLDLLR